jgi:hypothetical protein
MRALLQTTPPWPRPTGRWHGKRHRRSSKITTAMRRRSLQCLTGGVNLQGSCTSQLWITTPS